MLSKKMFVRTINFLEERDKQMDKINELFTKEFEDSIFYPYFKHEKMIVDILMEVMDDQGEWIEYYLYENDYGHDLKPDSVQEADGTPINITTPEKLYDFLVKEHETRKASAPKIKKII